MFHHDLYIGDHDAETAFFLALHHLQLASALFDRFSPSEFAEAKAGFAIPVETQRMMDAVTAGMELEAWLKDHKIKAAAEMAVYSDDDPALGPIWARHEEAMQERLAAEGYSDEEILSELGDMAAVLHKFREDDI